MGVKYVYRVLIVETKNVTSVKIGGLTQYALKIHGLNRHHEYISGANMPFALRIILGVEE